MLTLVSDNTVNVVPFPNAPAERPTIELVAVLSPPPSLVDRLVAERGLVRHDAKETAAREIAAQARVLHAAHGRDEAVSRLRALADAHVARAVALCREYRDALDDLAQLEDEAARAVRLEPGRELRLQAAREGLGDCAIAARVAADAAFGAVTAFSTYVLDGPAGLAPSKADPRQLSLFVAAG